MPLPLLCMRPMVAKFYRETRLQRDEKRSVSVQRHPDVAPARGEGSSRRHHRRPQRSPPVAPPARAPRAAAARRLRGQVHAAGTTHHARATRWKRECRAPRRPLWQAPAAGARGGRGGASRHFLPSARGARRGLPGGASRARAGGRPGGGRGARHGAGRGPGRREGGGTAWARSSARGPRSGRRLASTSPVFFCRFFRAPESSRAVPGGVQAEALGG